MPVDDTGLERLPSNGVPADAGLEFRHLRYLVALAEAGTFTLAAERLLIAQPTLSQQIRRLEAIVGTPLLFRRPFGVEPTEAGQVLLEESQAALSLLERTMARSRQAAGLGRPGLRFVLPQDLPERLAVATAARLRSAAAAAGADIGWVTASLDAEFTLIRQGQADAGLGWLTSSREALPDPIDAMTIGEFEPEVWIPAGAAGDRQFIGLDELADMDVLHGPRRTNPGVYDVWRAVLRASQPRFEFTDSPFQHSLPMTLAFAATASRPTAVLTSPLHATSDPAAYGARQRAAVRHDMIRVGLLWRPLTAIAAVAWSADLPRNLQQVLFDTAEAGFISADLSLPKGRHLSLDFTVRQDTSRCGLKQGWPLVSLSGIGPTPDQRGLADQRGWGIDEVPYGRALDPEAASRFRDPQAPVVVGVTSESHRVHEETALFPGLPARRQAGRQANELVPVVLEAFLRRQVGVDEQRVGRRVVRQQGEGRFVQPGGRLGVRHALGDEWLADHRGVAGGQNAGEQRPAGSHSTKMSTDGRIRAQMRRTSWMGWSLKSLITEMSKVPSWSSSAG
jgi:DNA-binding transcriptional LysR family regulator